MRKYVLTFVALLALTALTFGLSFVDLGAWGVPVALSIAAGKAGLIALVFMHLGAEGTPARLAALAALLLGVLLVVLASLDVSTRQRHELLQPVLTEPGPQPDPGMEIAR